MASDTTTSEEVGVSLPLPRENLVRALAEAPTLERADGATMPTLRGHFAVWDTWTTIDSPYEGRFLERVASTAMDKTIGESRDQMRVLFQHGNDPQIGDKVLGPISELRADTKGAYYEVPLFDTAYNRELIPGLEAGVYGASFRFQVMQEDFDAKPKRSDHNPNGLPERTITEARVREFGPVTFGAYSDATAGLRSMTDDFMFGRLIRDPERLRELILRFGTSTVLEPAPSVATTPNTSKESEPSEATTRSGRGLYWFAAPPSKTGAQ
jgi:HK97 family phage prohead protease